MMQAWFICVGGGSHLLYRRWVLGVLQATLDKWAYSDGTVFYLDRTEDENLERHRLALGEYVWRRADRTDALYSDCVGASCYRKAQGQPVRVWGLLAAGKLNIYILEKGGVMDRYLWNIMRNERCPELRHVTPKTKQQTRT